MNRPTTLTITVSLLLAHLGAAAADQVVLVQDGKARSVREVGDAWQRHQDVLEGGGTGNFLVAEKALGAGDFEVRARLSLERLDGTAASLVMGGNHFGFDGRGVTFFVEGPQWGRTRLLGDSRAHITPGKPFEIEVVRRGESLTFRIDGDEVHTGNDRLPPVCAVGLRPWRATLRVYDFSMSGNLTAATDTAIKTIQQDPGAMQPSDAITVGGATIHLASPPEGLSVHRDLGILAAGAIQGKVLHRSSHVWVPRATMTPKGDYLLLFPEGKGPWYQGKRMLAYRSSDQGKTWTGPTVAFDESQSHHGFVPLIPRGSTRIYAFGTQPIPGKVGARSEGLHENCPIGFRYSDDDGHSWSDVTLIRPQNDPDFTGMSCVRMCETDAGTWLIGSHDGRWHREGSPAPVTTRQYILRSEDKGETWTLLPGKRPHGWHLKKYDRMDEGTVVSLGGEKAALFIRTAEGHIWESRTDDDGKTWSEATPTTLVHPDAPPMIYTLGDGKTLISFIHNHYDPGKAHFDKKARNELWCSISKDQGRTWGAPRFVFAGATAGGHIHSSSYIDMFTDGPRIHVFLGQYGRQLLYLQFDESDLTTFLTREDLKPAARVTLEDWVRPPEGDLGTVLGAPRIDMHSLFQGERLPNIVVATDGTVVAQWGWGTVRVRRSEDGGTTWGPEIPIAEGLNAGGLTVDDVTGELLAFVEAEHPPAPLTVLRSQDHGRTWKDVPAEIRPDVHGNVLSMCMNEHGITLRHGRHRGRLLRPSRWYAGKNERARWPDMYTSAVYSDDGGVTWHASDPFPALGTGEAAVAELSDGRIYYNSRRHWAPEGENALRRWTAWSDDGGATWQDLSMCETLPDGAQHRSYGLMGGLVRLPVAGQDILVFSNIESPEGRHHGTVWASFNGGRTWPIKRLVYDGPFAYSSLAAGRPGTASESWIYLLFEGGPGSREGKRDGGTVARFNLAWVLGGERTGDGALPQWLSVAAGIDFGRSAGMRPPGNLAHRSAW